VNQSSETLRRFQDDQEIRRKLLASGAIRLTPETQQQGSEFLHQMVFSSGKSGVRIMPQAAKGVVSGLRHVSHPRRKK
jgi:hypothetical protein